MQVVKSVIVFMLAGLCEIGGGYLVWLWLKQDKPAWYGLCGMVILALYGVVATWQPSSFARAYATYGGFFIAISLAWAYLFDDFTPDTYDIIGAIIVLLGVCIIFFAPR
jgi:small multidrug resistance family-3 protein